MKIFVPQDTTYNKCYVVQSEGVIRGYAETPQVNRTINYRDYYINSDYIYRDGSQTFSQYSTTPTCLATNTITNDLYYRIDFVNILIMFTIFAYFIVFLPFKIISRAFGRWLKL